MQLGKREAQKQRYEIDEYALFKLSLLGKNLFFQAVAYGDSLFIYLFCINLFSVMNHNIFAYFRHKSI